MSENKPLHVRVAEALGQVPCDRWKPWGAGLSGTEWIKEIVCSHGNCYPPDNPPRYDTHWSATGPLIEKYRAWVHPCGCDAKPGRHWVSSCELDEHDAEGAGDTPLLAVCNLILALAEAGKLK